MVGAAQLRPRGQIRHRVPDRPRPERARCHTAISGKSPVAPSARGGSARLAQAVATPRAGRSCPRTAGVHHRFFLWIDADAGRSYSTGIGEQRTIQLLDGSTVELNARSRVKVRLTDHRRDVVLIEGQALFSVAKDKQRPFVVQAGDAQVRAVGTEFDVYKKQAETVVTVVEGRVETYSGADGAGAAAIMLSAGEQLTVLPHTVTKPTRADTAAATAWVQKRLIFEETPLNEVAEEFNRYNRRPLTIDDAELRTLKISGVYSSTDPASLINFLRSQNSINVIETENQVRVVRREAH